jgi:hypothetical protein
VPALAAAMIGGSDRYSTRSRLFDVYSMIAAWSIGVSGVAPGDPGTPSATRTGGSRPSAG